MSEAFSLAIAPMVDWTNTYFRQLMRLIAPTAILYTEMIALPAILRQKPSILAFHEEEHPLALQVGGSDRAGLCQSVDIAQALGFDELNVNLGCPSPRVQEGQFGACLMRKGDHVAQCIRAMKERARIPVTVKMRIGVDELDSYEFFSELAGQLIEAGVDKLIIHARSAWLKGLNPKQNRTIPPLRYEYVYRLQAAFPTFPIIINGQLNELSSIQAQQALVKGVMIGRLACENPYALAKIHRMLYPDGQILTRSQVVRSYLQRIRSETRAAPLSIVCRPLLNMAHGLPHSKQWKAQVMEVARVQSGENLLALGDTYDSLFSGEDSSELV